jgi:serine/threonine protein kinase
MGLSSAERVLIQPLHMLVSGQRGEPIFCYLHGGAAEQVRLLLQTTPFTGKGESALDEALAGIENGRDRLLRALAHTSANQRILDSQSVIRDLWREDRGLGPYPLLKVLADFQTGHAYYRAYRDHLVHQIRVWVLGLYLIYKQPKILNAMVKEVAAEDGWSDAGHDEVIVEALRRWQITALWHDIGYVFEVQCAARPQTLIERAFNDLHITLETPMAGLLGPGIISPGQERRWQASATDSVNLPTWPRLRSFDQLLTGENEQLWRMLAPAGWLAGLATSKEPCGGIRPYLEICRIKEELVTAAGDRPGFIDHGIAGALLLLRLHRFMVKYSHGAGQLLQHLPEMATEEQRRIIAEVAQRTAGTSDTVLAAARAVALHNIVPGLPLPDTAEARGLTPMGFRICLSDQPLAFLLGVADGLQGWDRPRFEAPLIPDDVGYIDQEVVLTANKEKIYLDLRMCEEEAFTAFSRWRQELGDRLKGIDQLLIRGVAKPSPLLEWETEWQPPHQPGIEPGTVLMDRWLLIRLLGRGGFGSVWEAEELQLGERWAIKVLSPAMAAQDETLSRFRHEFQLMRDMAHPRMVRVMAYDEDPEHNLALISMELIPGVSVRELLDLTRESKRQIPVQLALTIFEETLEALDASHAAGVLHRDVTPSNILLAGGIASELLDNPNLDPIVKLSDFGIAALIGRREHSTRSQTLGTAPYVAPEVHDPDADISQAVDIYGAGAIAYELLCTKLPIVTGHRPIAELREGIPDLAAHLVDSTIKINPADRPLASKALEIMRDIYDVRRRFDEIPKKSQPDPPNTVSSPSVPTTTNSQMRTDDYQPQVALIGGFKPFSFLFHSILIITATFCFAYSFYTLFFSEKTGFTLVGPIFTGLLCLLLIYKSQQIRIMDIQKYYIREMTGSINWRNHPVALIEDNKRSQRAINPGKSDSDLLDKNYEENLERLCFRAQIAAASTGGKFNPSDITSTILVANTEDRIFIPIVSSRYRYKEVLSASRIPFVNLDAFQQQYNESCTQRNLETHRSRFMMLRDFRERSKDHVSTAGIVFETETILNYTNVFHKCLTFRFEFLKELIQEGTDIDKYLFRQVVGMPIFISSKKIGVFLLLSRRSHTFYGKDKIYRIIQNCIGSEISIGFSIGYFARLGFPNLSSFPEILGPNHPLVKRTKKLIMDVSSDFNRQTEV